MKNVCCNLGYVKYKDIITYLLTPWCRVLLEKLTCLQLVKKFPAFPGTRRFNTALTSVRHLSLSWVSPVHIPTSHLLEIRPSVEIVLISFLVVLAAITKIAQIPFSSRLPAPVAAHTPVSALVHSSTLVTAGVYVLIRFRPSFSYWSNVILLLVSVLTMFIAGLGANFELDLRRIIALSTLRQLGLMIMAICIGLSGLAFFLFVNSRIV